MYTSMTCCFIFFILSSILWIILFRSLSIKNKHIYDIVYDIPTLGVYHNKYTEFYTKYDRNRDELFETEKILTAGGDG